MTDDLVGMGDPSTHFTSKKRLQLPALGSVMGLALGSQIASAAAAAAVLTLEPRLGDVYIVGQQVGTAALGAVSLSVVYLIAIGRPQWNGWRRASWISSLCSVLAGFGAMAVLELRSGYEQAICAIPALFGVGGALLASAGVYAVRRACLGRPVATAGVTIGPSAALFATTLVASSQMKNGSPAWVYAPVVAWMLASLLVLAIVRALPLPALTNLLEASDETQANQRLHIAGAAVSSGLGIAMPTLLMISLTTLPPGTATIVSIGNRIGSSIVALGVNSLLLVRINWGAEFQAKWRIPNVLVLVALTATMAAGLLSRFSSTAALIAALIAWLFAIVATPIVTRLAHTTRRGRAVFGKSMLEVACAPAIIGSAWLHPSGASMFLAYVAISSVSTAAIAVAYRQWSLSTLSVLSFATALATIWIY